jgi:hypothetical protein
MSTPHRLAVLVVVAMLVSLVPAGATVAQRRLPPPDRDDLAAIFDPKVEALGFRTTRARLQNLDTYETDPKGRHLAIYLEPIEEDFTDEEYVASFIETSRVFLPRVFNRWRGLRTFDVCLEPLPSEDAREEPPPITQIFVSRDSVGAVSWKTVTLADLIALSEEYGKSQKTADEFYVYFDVRLDAVPELVSARQEAALD